MPNLSTSTSSISSSSSSIPSIPNDVLGDGSAEFIKKGFYYRDSSFLIEENLSFIVTEASQKFILDFDGRRTIDGESEITDKENIR